MIGLNKLRANIGSYELYSSIDNLTILYLLLALLSYFLAPSVFSLILAFVGLIYIPGFRLVTLAIDAKEINKIGFAPVVGLALHALLVLLAYGTSKTLFMDLKLYLILCTFLLNIGFDIICHLHRTKDIARISYFIGMHKCQFHNGYVKFSTILFLIFLASGIFLSTANNSGLTPDGALYSCLASNIASHGIFSVNILNRDIQFPFDDFNGVIRNQVTWFLLGIFFAFGGISFANGNLYAVVLGSLLIFPVYEISRIWFDSWQVPMFASLFLLLCPQIRFFSIVLMGADITGLLFGVSAVALLEFMRVKKQVSLKSSAIVSLLLGASMLSQETLFTILYLLPIVILCILEKRLTRSLTISMLLIALFFTHSLSVSSRQSFAPVVFLGLFIPIFFIFRKKDNIVASFAFIMIVLVIFIQLRANRYYMFPGSKKYQIVLPTGILAAPLDLTRVYNTAVEIAKWFSSSYLVLLTALSACKAIIIFKERNWNQSYPILYVFVDLVARSFFQTSGILGTGGTLVTGRFFLADVTFIIILASSFISFVLQWLYHTILKSYQSRYNQHLLILVGHRRHHIIKIEITKLFLFMTVAGLIISTNLPDCLTLINEGLKQVRYMPTIVNMQAEEWILNNTSVHDRILVASTGYVSFWCLSVNSRTFISTGETYNSIQLDLDDLLLISRQFNASYVILDSTTPWLYPSLSKYYSESLQTGEIVRTNTDLNLKVVFVSQSNPLVIIFKIIPTNVKHIGTFYHSAKLN